MVYAKGRHPGAIWRKTDFQIHTPRDAQWNGPHYPGGGSQLEQAREKWADEFVAACLRFGLGAISITDHHDFCFVPYVQRAIARAKAEGSLWLYPGAEVTCNDSVQCLILFDVGTDASMWNRLFGGHLPSIPQTPCDSEALPQTILCGKDVAEFVAGISDDVVLVNQAIVLPHASDEGAHKSMMRQGFHERFKSLSVDGFYSDKAIGRLDPKIVAKIHGKMSAWGTRRRGILPTSDSRIDSFATVGTNDCWVKLGEPSVEAIRQALLADEARITYATPSVPSQRILEMRVNSSLCGDNFQLIINDGFTAIIGGRGSGKSAILEYLRFGLGRSTSDIAAQEGEFQRQKELITQTLVSGYVTLTMERDGVVETWHRSGVQPDVITVTVVGSQPEKITIEAAQQRFRARAFAQKQLSTLLTSARDAAEQITGIAAAEAIDRRQVIELEVGRSKRAVQSSMQKVVDFWAAESAQVTASSAVQDLIRRIAATKKRLEESGLSVENQLILDQAPAFSLARALLQEAKTSLAADVGAVQEVAVRIPSVDLARWEKVGNFDEVSAFIRQAQEGRGSVQAGLASASSALEQIENARRAAEEGFESRFTEFELRHKTALAQQQNLSSLVEEASRLNKELLDAETRERRTQSQVRALQQAEPELEAARGALDEQLRQYRQLLGEAALSVSRMSDGMLKAEVLRESVPRQYLDSMSSLCENHRVRDGQTRCEDRIGVLVDPKSAETWRAFGDRFVRLLKARVQGGGVVPEPSKAVMQELQSLLFELTDQQVRGIYAGLDVSKVAAILTATPGDYISFEYRDRDRYIPFSQASPGQQAAALLNLLLRQEAGTLIIDQPEDDLDNKVIMNIVSLVQTAKRKRQLIFTTHNANFVVNGDADKVVALTPGTAEGTQASQSVLGTPRILIDVDGAIETPDVRKTITETVEGGEKAFELRSRKYQFKIQ